MQKICFYCNDESVKKNRSTLSLFVVSLCRSDLGGGGWLLSVDGWSIGGWAAESWIHGLSSRGPGSRGGASGETGDGGRSSYCWGAIVRDGRRA